MSLPGQAVSTGAEVSPAGDGGLQGVQGVQGPVGPASTVPGPQGIQGIQGVPGPGYASTSPTSNAIGTGLKTFTTQLGLAYTAGARARISSRGTPTKWMEGIVNAYDPASGVLQLNVDMTSDTAAAAATPTPIVFRNYLGGLELAPAATTITIATGCACSDDGSTMMTLSAAITKVINAAWSAGNGNGGLDTGAIANNTWYNVFLIGNVSSGAVDVLFVVGALGSIPAPTMPTGYTVKRRIGSFATGSTGQVTPFTQLGDDFLWVTTPINYSNATMVQAQTSYYLSVPPGLKVIAFFSIHVNVGTASWMLVQSPDATNAPNDPPGNNNMYTLPQSNDFRIRTNTNQQINIGCGATSGGLYLLTRGWNDSRGK